MFTHLNIAVVEDHDDLREVLVACIEERGHNVFGADCAEALDELMAERCLDLLVLDIGLPGENGFEIARRLKTAHPQLFIIMTTALNSSAKKVAGYDCGADVYLTKPVAVEELMAAIQNIGRRIASFRNSSINLWLDLTKMQLIGAEQIDLNREEIAILKGLIEAPMQRLPYYRLLELTEKDISETSKSTLGVQLVRLRKKLQKAGLDKQAIKVNWGEGYQLTTSIRIR